MSKILSTSTVLPDYLYSTDQIINAIKKDWLPEVNEREHRKIIKIFEGSQIDTRSSVLPLDQVFKATSFQEKNDIYMKKSIELGGKALKKALELANIKANEIDIIITTSCTGFMIPSLDAHLVNQFGMRKDIIRLPVTEMGCAGGTSCLIYADRFLKSDPNLHIAIVSVELPSLTFQNQDLSMENVVSSAIFADGASAIILGPSNEMKPTIVDTNMYHFEDSTHLMGYHLQNAGLKIILDRDVPNEINKQFKNFFLPFLDKNRLQPQDIHHYMFHPGGKKIINSVQEYISQFGKDISDSVDILKKHGNMSSSTIIYILDRFMNKKNIQKNDLGYMLAFGPGFMAQSLLVRWE